MDQSDTSVLLAWIALGQAAPVVALGLVCLICASLVAVVIGGISAFGANARITIPTSKSVRVALAIFALCCGGYSLKLMLGGMNIDGFELFKAVGLYIAAMAFFVGAQYAGSEQTQAVSDTQYKLDEFKAESRDTRKRAA